MATRSSSTSGSGSSTRARRRQSGQIEQKGSIEQQNDDIVFIGESSKPEELPPLRKRRRKVEDTPGESGNGGAATASKISPISSEPRNLRRRTRRVSYLDAKSPTPPPTSQTSEFLYRLGDKLEARDEYGKWYSARVADIDEEANSVLIHFDYWSTRYDEWIDVKSARLRPLVEKPRNDKNSIFKIGDFVLARWSMSKYYPAKILAVVDDSRFNVLFYDGVESVVKFRELRQMPEDQIQKLDMATFGQPGYFFTLPKQEPTESAEESQPEIDPPIEKEGYFTKIIKRKDKFLTMTQKWMLRQKEDKRAQRRAAIGVSLAVAQLTPSRQKKTDETSTLITEKSDSVFENTEIKVEPTSTTTMKCNTSTRSSVERDPLFVLKLADVDQSPSPASGTSNDSLACPKGVADREHSSENVPRGSKSGRKSAEDAGSTSLAYQSYKFKPTWLEEYEWLRFDNGAMYCKYCRESYPDAKHGFVQGITNGFLAHRVSGHEKSRFHSEAMEKAGKNTKKVESNKLEGENSIKDESSVSKTPSTHVEKIQPATTLGSSMNPVVMIDEALSTSESTSDQADTERAQRLFMFWSSGRESWLRMENNKFYCLPCRIHEQKFPGSRSIWSMGVSLNQAVSIRQHGQSPLHLVAMQHMTEGQGEGEQLSEQATNSNEETCVKSVVSNEEAFPPPPQSTTLSSAKTEQGGGRKRKRSCESETSFESSSRSVSTVTAVETPNSHQSSMDKKQTDWQDRHGTCSDAEDSPRSSSLSHLADDDVVRCVCATGGEDGLMLQCEQCMTWQHGDCVGISEPEETPSPYICYVCKDPPRSRPSMRYRYEVQKAWLETGVLPSYPWTPTDASVNVYKTKVAQSTNNASRALTMLTDRLRAARTLIHQVNKMPHGPATVNRKAAIKDQIVAVQSAVEKELDKLEPFVTELESKYFAGRTSTAETEYAQSKVTICALLRDLDKLRKLQYFLQ